jgi:hypothetical protein
MLMMSSRSVRSFAHGVEKSAARSTMTSASAFATGLAVGKLTHSPRQQTIAAAVSGGLGVLSHLIGPTILPAGPTAAFADGSIAAAATIFGSQLGARIKR